MGLPVVGRPQGRPRDGPGTQVPGGVGHPGDGGDPTVVCVTGLKGQVLVAEMPRRGDGPTTAADAEGYGEGPPTGASRGEVVPDTALTARQVVRPLTVVDREGVPLGTGGRVPRLRTTAPGQTPRRRGRRDVPTPVTEQGTTSGMTVCWKTGLGTTSSPVRAEVPQLRPRVHTFEPRSRRPLGPTGLPTAPWDTTRRDTFTTLDERGPAGGVDTDKMVTDTTVRDESSILGEGENDLWVGALPTPTPRTMFGQDIPTYRNRRTI